jgi:ABC-2 type transport system ATP-binding protein
MAVIQVNGLTKRFGAVLAVDRLSFEVRSGAVTGFLGPNGAGKTTTLRMLLGLVAPTAGTATIDGRPYRELADPLHHVGAVLEASSFHPGRTARNHLLVQAMAGRISRSRVDEVLELVGLGDALLDDPEVLILDEPANGLDPEGVRWLRELLRGLAEEGRTVLVSSHILAEVAQTVDEVVILDHGRLVVQSTLEELTAGTHRTVRVRTPRAEELRAALLAEGAQARLVAPDRLEVSGTTVERVGMLAAARAIPIFESTTGAANLEDVFFQLTAAPAAQEAAR